jgi:hypothetical protein
MDLYTKMNAPVESEEVVSPVSPLIEDDEIPF